jgi:hypothetical protein
MKKRTRIVPSLVITATFVGVIPACVLGACGGTTTADDGGADGSKDAKFFADGVAADAFKNDVILGVAAVAMCCFDASGEGG